MMCYRDMTFCKFFTECKEGEGCPRALTMDVISGAEKWFGGKVASICEYVNKPDCFEKR